MYTLLVVGIGIVGALLGWILGYRKASRRSEDIERAAHLDKLTGLFDRAIVENAIDDATKSGVNLTIGVCDVNGLHDINESLGHAAGDQLLLAVSHRLLDLLPEGEGLVARTGGDEFWIATSQSPQSLVDAYTSDIDGLAHRASVGVASSPQNGSPRHAVLCADLAMYSAKSSHTPAMIYNQSTMGTPEEQNEGLPEEIKYEHRHHERRQKERRKRA